VADTTRNLCAISGKVQGVFIAKLQANGFAAQVSGIEQLAGAVQAEPDE